MIFQIVMVCWLFLLPDEVATVFLDSERIVQESDGDIIVNICVSVSLPLFGSAVDFIGLLSLITGRDDEAGEGQLGFIGQLGLIGHFCINYYRCLVCYKPLPWPGRH